MLLKLLMSRGVTILRDAAVVGGCYYGGGVLGST